MNLWIDCEKKPITELLEFIVDNRGKSVPTTDKGHILIATNCIRNDHLYPKYEKIRYLSQETYETFFRSHPLPGDIIFVNKGTPGRVCLVPDPIDFCIAQDMIALRANKNLVDSHYLFAVLRSPMIQTQIHNTYVGDVIPHFKKQFMDRLLIPLPSMDTQKKIGEIYYTICDKIEVNRRINEQLEELAGALFKSWFVDFEPFKDGEFVDSELGMIPKGWRVGTLGDIASIASGKRPPIKQTEMSKDVNIPLIGASSIMGYTNAILCDSKILVIGRVGTHGIVQRFGIPCWPSDNTLIITSKYYEYSYQILKTIDYKSLNRGSTQPLITQTDIKNQQVILPPEKVLLDFEFIILALMNKADNNLKEINYLSTLRDTLLPKLMSGEIDVDEVEI